MAFNPNRSKDPAPDYILGAVGSETARILQYVCNAKTPFHFAHCKDSSEHSKHRKKYSLHARLSAKMSQYKQPEVPFLNMGRRYPILINGTSIDEAVVRLKN